MGCIAHSHGADYTKEANTVKKIILVLDGVIFAARFLVTRLRTETYPPPSAKVKSSPSLTSRETFRRQRYGIGSKRITKSVRTCTAL